MLRKMAEIYLAECYQRPESDASHGFAFSQKSCDRCDQDPPAGCRGTEAQASGKATSQVPPQAAPTARG